MFLTLLQSQGGPPPPVVVTDTSDILDRNLKRQRQEEENIAAQLLKARQKTKHRQEKIKKTVDWKKLISDKINGVTTEDELNALVLSNETIASDSAIFIEIERQKELKRAELQTAEKEAELKLLKGKSKVKAKLLQLEMAKAFQMQMLEKYRVAQQAAIEEEAKAAYEASIAEKAYLEFKRKRDNRIKRLKALMWLTKLDL